MKNFSYTVLPVFMPIPTKFRLSLFTAKPSERQVVASNDKDGGSRVARFTSLRTETWYKAKWEWIRLHNKSMSEW